MTVLIVLRVTFTSVPPAKTLAQLVKTPASSRASSYRAPLLADYFGSSMTALSFPLLIARLSAA